MMRVKVRPACVWVLVFLVLGVVGCAQRGDHISGEPGPIRAFPGAEGFGAFAVGGRSGDVYEVTNLNDDGPGSLRDGLSQGHRTVVFRVSGTIELESRLTLNQPYVTIAGETAPGDGVCLRGKELMIADTEHVIVRFLRFRPGDELGEEHDALTVWNSANVIVDHCSMSWSTDSLNDVVKKSGNVTISWCLLAEPLHRSVHEKGGHGYATGWDGRVTGGGSFHHNLIAHAYSRAPRIGYHHEGRGMNECVNNVIYNSGPAYGAEGGDLNYLGNFYRAGPSGLREDGELFQLWAEDTRMFIAGNVFEGNQAVSTNNALGVVFRRGATAETSTRDPEVLERCLVENPFAMSGMQSEPAEAAYDTVLAGAGATLPRRDSVDQRVLDDVINRTGGLIDSQREVGGWPDLTSVPAPPDRDHDGMPDAWEQQHGLNPDDTSDGRRSVQPDGYTNLERYLHHLAEAAPR